MSEHAVAPHVHSFPACECGQEISALLDNCAETMRAQAQALAASQQRRDAAERLTDELACYIETLRAGLERAVKAVESITERHTTLNIIVHGGTEHRDSQESRQSCALCSALSHPTPTTQEEGRR